MFDDSTLMGRIVTFSMLGLLGWLAVTTYNLSMDTAILMTEMSGTKELIVQMQNNYITQAEANIRFTQLENELIRMRDTLRQMALGRPVDDP